jgi:L,D-transpeptidase ErfK/SrfK
MQRLIDACSRWSAAGLLLAALVLSPVSRATVFTLPADGGSLVGQDSSVQAKASDTLLGIARRYSVGYWEIQEANPHVDMWLPGRGTTVVIPGRLIVPPVAHVGIIVNLPQHRLFYFPKRRRHDLPMVITYPVSPGEKGWATPVGHTRIIRKVPHPVWIPTPSILKAHEEEGDPIPRIYPAGPDNPMGEWALETSLSGGEIYIHGTNNPMAVGMAVTHGCVRLYPEDIAALFPIVPVGTPVNIVNVPVLATLESGKLWLEVHPPMDSDHTPIPPDYTQISRIIDQAIGKNVVAIDWAKVRKVATLSNGIPEMVGVQAGYTPPPPAGTQTQVTKSRLSGSRRATPAVAGTT